MFEELTMSEIEILTAYLTAGAEVYRVTHGSSNAGYNELRLLALDTYFEAVNAA